MKIKRIQHITISCLFLLIIISVFLNQSLQILSSNTGTYENRTLAKKPKIDINRLDFFPEQYESYYNDNFFFRAQYISFMSFLSQQVFDKVSTKMNFIIGKEDWIFEIKKDLPWYLGKKEFTNEQLGKIETELLRRHNYLKQRNCRMYLLICPSKYSVYPEKLPDILNRKRKTRTDRFIDKIGANSLINISDGRKSLNNRKADHNVYFKFDTHWNHLGAFFSISDLMDTIRQDYSNIPNFELSDFTIDTVRKEDGNLKNVLSSTQEVFELDYLLKNEDEHIFECNGYEYKKPDDFPYSQSEFYKRYCSQTEKNALKAVVIRDSYANFSFDILPAYFKETIYIWDKWEYKLNKEIIEREKPDIVIYFIYEGLLERLLMKPSFVEAEDIDQELQ